MSKLDRRNFIGTLALAGVAADASAEAPKAVTRTLARYIVGAQPQDLPEAVRKEATRTLLNWAGCAVGGSRQDAVNDAIHALSPFFRPAQAGLVGRRARLHVLTPG